MQTMRRSANAQKNGVRAVAPTAGTPLQRRLRLRRCACQFFEAHFLVRHLRLAEDEIDDVGFNDVRFHFGKALLVGIIPADDFLRVFVALGEFVHFRADLLGLGLQDAFRLFEQAEKSFSWWDYRMMAFRRNFGLRIDHLLISAPLVPTAQRCWVDKAPRKLERPSDHTPVIVEFSSAN